MANRLALNRPPMVSNLMKHCSQEKTSFLRAAKISVRKETDRVKRVTSVNSHETISMLRSLSFLTLMAVERLQRRILIQFQNRWGGTQAKVSGLLLPLQSLLYSSGGAHL